MQNLPERISLEDSSVWKGGAPLGGGVLGNQGEAAGEPMSGSPASLFAPS